MAQVIRLKVDRVTLKERKLNATAKEFHDLGIDWRGSIVAAYFFQKLQRLEQKVKRLEKRRTK